jgi:hypothetical protein
VVKENPLRRLLTPVISLALILGACGGDDADPASTLEVADDQAPPSSSIPPTTTIPLVETTTTVAVPAGVTGDAAIAFVVAAIEAKNSFDLETWLMAYEGGKRQGTPLHAEKILMNARQHWEIVDPCQVTGETPSGDTIVECLIQDVNVFWGVGGISDTKTRKWTVNTDGLITNNENSFASNRRNAFNRAFHQWLSDTYPDVYSEMGFGSISSNGPGFDRKNPELMLIAVEYVEEFVAQSDKYPLDPSDQ